MIKLFNNESEFEIFKNVLSSSSILEFKNSQNLFNKLKNSSWTDNTNSRPDFISEKFMIEMFEVDDIVTTKKGKNNPQREADARTLREVEYFIQNNIDNDITSKDIKIIAHGNPQYNLNNRYYSENNHHNYLAYINNFKRICGKHLNKIQDYKNNSPQKKLGFLIIDDATYYIKKTQLFFGNFISQENALLNLPFFDANFMELFIDSDVDFIIWAFNNKHFYTVDDIKPKIPEVTIINKDDFSNLHSSFFNPKIMESLEE